MSEILQHNFKTEKPVSIFTTTIVDSDMTTKIEEEITNLDISKDQPIYLYCRSGNRSGKATQILEKIGYTNAINAGGINEAAKKLDKKIVNYSE